MALSPTLSFGPRTLADVTAEVTAKEVKTYFDAAIPGGSSVAMAASAFTTVICTTVTADATPANYTVATGIYKVPVTGTYRILTKLRLADFNVTQSGYSYGIGAHTSNIDGSWFSWFVTAPSRNGALNIRISKFVVGDQIRMYAFADGFTANIGSAELSIELLF